MPITVTLCVMVNSLELVLSIPVLLILGTYKLNVLTGITTIMNDLFIGAHIQIF